MPFCMTASGYLHANEYLLELPVCLSLLWATLPPTFPGDPPILAGRSGPASYEVTAFFPWVLVCTPPCVRPLRVELLLPPVLWNSSNQTLMVFKARFCGGTSSCCQIPRLGHLAWGSGLPILWQNFCDVIGFLFVHRPPSEYGTWLYRNCVTPVILLWPLHLWM